MTLRYTLKKNARSYSPLTPKSPMAESDIQSGILPPEQESIANEGSSGERESTITYGTGDGEEASLMPSEQSAIEQESTIANTSDTIGADSSIHKVTQVDDLNVGHDATIGGTLKAYKESLPKSDRPVKDGTGIYSDGAAYAYTPTQIEKDTTNISLGVLGLRLLNAAGVAVGGWTDIPVGMSDKDRAGIDVSISQLLAAISGKYLRKDSPDTAQGVITFLEGIRSRGDVIIGEQGFANGLPGYGMKLGRDGAAEMRSLILNESLEVPELRYNRVDVYVGNQWRAPGAGIVKAVVPDTNSDGTTANTGTVYLKLEEGEIGKVAVDDICMGIFHDNNTANNATDDYDDYKGNFRFSGFYTCYFRITEITETATNASFRYALRQYSDGTFSKHPSAYMHFVCYGNFTNKDRQSSRYSTLRYERMLVNVNTWEFQAANIAMQEGDLDNLKVYGLDMTGYSIYLENIYMSGTIKQIEKLAVRMEIENTFSETLDFGETAPLRIFLTRGFDDFTEKAVKWSVTRDSGDATNDAAWQQKAKVVAFNNTPTIKTTEDGQRKYVGFDIAFKDGDNDLSMEELSTLFTFKAYDKDSAVLATKSIAI